MPSLAAISTINFPYKIEQTVVKKFAKDLFSPNYPQAERMLAAFDNTAIITRNLCKPIEYYLENNSFELQNKQYISIAVEYSIIAINQCLATAQLNKLAITDIVFVSSTGLATPSIDALIINEMHLNQHINRTPIFGLGCAGGVAAFAKAAVAAIANPNAVVLVLAVELCSLTFLKSDYSKSNFIGSSLFSDGVSACIITGGNVKNITEKNISYLASQSKLYYNTQGVMGWDFLDTGFKVLFSQDIPTIIATNICNDITDFLQKNNLTISDIKNFVFHLGGKKVLEAYQHALKVEGDFLKNTREVMNENGNMSSPTVLYVLEKFFNAGFQNGYGLMVAMGPGFCSEMVLLSINNNN